MTPSHFGGAQNHLECAPRPTRFGSWNRPETVERASIEARSEAPESHRRVRGTNQVLLGDEMLHRHGACRDRSSERLCVLPEGLTRGGQRCGMDRGLGLLLRDYGP